MVLSAITSSQAHCIWPALAVLVLTATESKPGNLHQPLLLLLLLLLLLFLLPGDQPEHRHIRVIPGG
jgi:hypothetical protein